MSRDSGTGCGVIIIAFVVIVVVLLIGKEFLDDMANYHSTGIKKYADSAGFYFMLLAGVAYLIYRFFKSDS